ncbi:MAG: TRAP transporter substrate-binding protein [Rhodospirillaceae bacterium]
MKKYLSALGMGLVAAAVGFAGPAFAAKYELKLATVVKAPHPWITGAEFMAKEMAKRTKGEVDIKVYDSGSLGNDKTAIDQMRLGTIDLVIGGTTNATAFVKDFQVFSIDYLFKDLNAFRKVTAPDSPVFKHIQGKVAKKGVGFELLALCSGGTRNFSNSLRPVKTPSDLDGMKMRVPGAKMASVMWSALGAVPTSLPWTEVYSATQTGVVNAFESTISSYYGAKLYEVAPYHSKTEHQIMTSHISVGSATLKKLPAAYAKILREVAADAGKVITDKGEEYDAQFIKQLESKGAKVTAVDKKAFMDKIVPLHEQFAKEAGAEDMLKMIRDMTK